MTTEEYEQLVNELSELVTNVKRMTPEDADERWQAFGDNLRIWNEEAHMNLTKETNRDT